MNAARLCALSSALWLQQCVCWPGTGAQLLAQNENGAGTMESTELGWRRPSIQAVRVEHAPKIDGRLDDEVWARAPVGGQLYEAYQHPGRLMSERTEFRVLYDDSSLDRRPTPTNWLLLWPQPAVSQ